MTARISRRGEQYLKTAETLLRAAQTMIDRAIAGQLEAVAEDCGKPSKLRMLMRPKHSLVQPPTPKAIGHDLLGSNRAQSCGRYAWGTLGCPARDPVTSFLSLRYRLQSFKIGADILNRNEMIFIIFRRTWSLTADSFSSQCLERTWVKLFDLSQSLNASESA